MVDWDSLEREVIAKIEEVKFNSIFKLTAHNATTLFFYTLRKLEIDFKGVAII